MNRYIQGGRAARLRPLSIAARSVYTALCSRANEEGYCWPSVRRIAADTSVSPRHVNRMIKLLAEMGLIEYIQQYDGEGHYVSNFYKCQYPPDTMSVPPLTPRQYPPDTMSDHKIHKKIQEEESIEAHAQMTLAAVKQKGRIPPAKKRSKAAEIEISKGDPKTLSALWEKEISRKFGEGMCVLKGKEKHQLTMLRKLVGDSRVRWLVTSALGNWEDFAGSVKHSKGLSKVPLAPSVGFLLNYCQEGLWWLSNREKKLSTEPKTIMKVPAKTTVVEQTKSKVASKAEFLEKFGEYLNVEDDDPSGKA